MSAEFEAQILADLRRTHAQLKAGTEAATHTGDPSSAPWSMRLTIEEVDLLLAIVDERDELRRQTVGDWEPELPPVRVESVVDTSYPLPPAEVPQEATVTIRTCPHAGTHHNCPRGGCPTFEPRAVTIPDLPAPITGSAILGAAMLAPMFSGGIKAAAEREDTLGREARETPPIVYQWRATGCAWGGDRMGVEASMRHYARMHGGRLERRIAAGPWEPIA